MSFAFELCFVPSEHDEEGLIFFLMSDVELILEIKGFIRL